MDGDEFDLDLETADGPNLPAPQADWSCTLIQRGVAGNVEDTDIGYGNGANWAAGAYPFTWTGPSPYDHWSVYKFDLSPVPPGKQITQAIFSVHASWTQYNSTVSAHQVTAPWSEATATWANFGGTASWDPAVLGTFDPFPGGFRSVDITGLASQWYSGAAANNGILTEEPSGPNAHPHEYYGSEVSTVVRRPSLWVCWVDAPPPPPDCGNAGVECSVDADCCDGMPCDGGVCGASVCGGSGASCNVNGDCCDGYVCNGETCAVPPPVCAPAGGQCGPGLPCCNGGLCSEGTCPGGVPACVSQIGGLCDSNADCCAGSCADGMCVKMNQCLTPDSGQNCNAQNPCCNGGHCFFDMCFWDLTCTIPGGSCVDGDFCCWGMECTNGVCQ